LQHHAPVILEIDAAACVLMPTHYIGACNLYILLFFYQTAYIMQKNNMHRRYMSDLGHCFVYSQTIKCARIVAKQNLNLTAWSKTPNSCKKLYTRKVLLSLRKLGQFSKTEAHICVSHKN
jgi:hypothetical protein